MSWITVKSGGRLEKHYYTDHTSICGTSKLDATMASSDSQHCRVCAGILKSRMYGKVIGVELLVRNLDSIQKTSLGTGIFYEITNYLTYHGSVSRKGFDVLVSDHYRARPGTVLSIMVHDKQAMVSNGIIYPAIRSDV